MTVSHKPVRIARVITRLNIGGPSIQAIGLSSDLQRRGFETCLIHGRLGHGEGDMRTFMPLAGITAIYVAEMVRPISPFNDVRAFWRIYRALCLWQPDIVHTHMAKAGVLGRLAGLLYNWTSGPTRRTSLIHTYHGHVFDGYFGAVSTRVFLSVERWLARRTDRLIAISPAVRHELLATYRIGRDEQVRVVPLGFNLDRLLAIGGEARKAARAGLGFSDDMIVISTVGRLTAIKHHSLFLDMAARLTRESQRYVFLIVGDGELRTALAAQMSALGLDRRVQFLGWRGDLDRIYAATDVFVLTSRNEGTPVALIEAMASGVASVSTDVGGVRDVIVGPDSGTLVPFGQPHLLADAVARLADSTELRCEMGLSAREVVRKRFEVERLRANVENLYADVLASPSAV